MQRVTTEPQGPFNPATRTPRYFRQCNPEALDPETRLSGVMDQLAVEVEFGAIIGLQEVSLSWAGPLQASSGCNFIQSFILDPHFHSPLFSRACELS